MDTQKYNLQVNTKAILISNIANALDEDIILVKYI